MTSVGPGRGQRLIGLFAFAILIALTVAIAIDAGFHRFLYFVETGILGTGVGWFSFKVNRERLFTAVLLGLLTIGVVLLREWLMAGMLALGLVVLTIVRHLPGLTSFESDSSR
jgi:hypothetical protein